jgi:hypothetical protein
LEPASQDFKASSDWISAVQISSAKYDEAWDGSGAKIKARGKVAGLTATTCVDCRGKASWIAQLNA